MIIRMSKPLTRTEDDVERKNLLKDQVSKLNDQHRERMHVPAVEPVGSNPNFFFTYSIFD